MAIAMYFPPVQAALRTAVFVLKLMPMLPSKALDYVTPIPVIEKLEYPMVDGRATGDFYRPGGKGRHPGIVVCLGVVPFEVDHPQVPRLGEALARSGLAALLYWSPALRDFRLDPSDIENIALAYERVIAEPGVDASRSGLMGMCVGGSFALMAAAQPLIRDRVAFVAAFAPYGSLLSLGRDIASRSRTLDGERLDWAVDPLTRKVFVHSITSLLQPNEAQILRDVFDSEVGEVNPAILSRAGQAVYGFLMARNLEEAEAAMEGLPDELRTGLARLSPVNHVQNIRAPLLAISHDRDDTVIPVGESRSLVSLLGPSECLRYTEFEMFQHADPTRRHLSPRNLAWQLSKFFAWLYSVFRIAFR